VDSQAVSEELKNRAIRKISQAQIFEELSKVGAQSMNDYLLCAKRKIFFSSACSDSIAVINKSIIQILPLKNEISGQLSGKKKEVFDAYLYSKENNLPSEENMQFLNEDSLLYSKVITDSREVKAQSTDSVYLFLLSVPKKIILQNL